MQAICVIAWAETLSRQMTWAKYISCKEKKKRASQVRFEIGTSLLWVTRSFNKLKKVTELKIICASAVLMIATNLKFAHRTPLLPSSWGNHPLFACTWLLSVSIFAFVVPLHGPPHGRILDLLCHCGFFATRSLYIRRSFCKNIYVSRTHEVVQYQIKKRKEGLGSDGFRNNYSHENAKPSKGRELRWQRRWNCTNPSIISLYGSARFGSALIAHKRDCQRYLVCLVASLQFVQELCPIHYATSMHAGSRVFL